MSLRFTSCLLLLGLGIAASGCDRFESKQPPQPGSLTNHLTMIGVDGRNYGVVELDPINGGKVYDSQGRLIGRVVGVGPEPVAPTVIGAPVQ